MSERRVTMRAVSAMTAREFGVSFGTMRSVSRTGDVALARQVAMYLIVTELGKTLPEAGQFFSGRDHTTVLHANRKVAALCEGDDAFARRIECLREKILAAEAGISSLPIETEVEVVAPPPEEAIALPPPKVVFAIPASVGRLTSAVDVYLKARKRLEADRFSAHEGPSRRSEEQALSGLRIAYHDYLAGGSAA